MKDPSWRAAWVALSLSRHIGGKTLRALLAHCGDDPRAILETDAKTLREVPGVGPKIAQAITTLDVNTTIDNLARWQAQGVRVITRRDSDYPSLLLELDDEPPTLFVRGNWSPDLFQRAAAMVGTRRPTKQSRAITTRFSTVLSERGYTIVSGLAYGVDETAHRGTLNADGRTVAVLGSGILNVYPPEHRELADAICEKGALCCEVSPDATVSSPGLVARNRMISGLSHALVVIETQADGGAMHAARFAFAQGRRVYAVQNRASGNRVLLKQGAIPLPVDGADDGL